MRDTQSSNVTGQAEEPEEYYVSGSWESLMMSHGPEEMRRFKMIPIKELVAGLDPSIVTWEQY